MTIADNSVVSMHYVLTNAAGEQLDSSEGGPLTYLHGHQNIIPGLEQALTGKASGDKLQVEIRPADAYGTHSPELVEVVPRSAFDGVDQIESGMQFQAQTPDGAQMITVTKVDGDQVSIDGNHPRAGEVLNFQVEVTKVRAASEEEIAHGHVHGPGGHDH